MSGDNKFFLVVVVIVSVIVGIAIYSDHKDNETYGKKVYDRFTSEV